jgi:Ni/Fe-hydrogenase 1 B-type cytochrome subunit
MVLKFYLTLGKAPLPKWYSHNPLWGPLYLLLFFFLILCSISGLILLKDISMIGALSLRDLHHLSYIVIGTFTLLHIPAVFSHDLAGKGSDVSSMINGYRVFEVASPEESNKLEKGTHVVAFQDLLKSRKR